LLISDAHCFFNEGFNNLGLRNRLDDFTLDEDLAFTVTGCNAQIGVTSLARTVDHAAHNSHAQWEFHAVQTSGDFFSQLVHIHLCATTGWAGYDFQLAWTQVHRLQNLLAYLDFLNSVRGQGHTNGVANALRKQRTEGHGGLNGAHKLRPSLSHAQVQWVVGLLCELTVGSHHQHGDRVLDGDRNIAVAVLFKQASFPDGGFHQCFWGGLTVLF